MIKRFKGRISRFFSFGRSMLDTTERRLLLAQYRDRRNVLLNFRSLFMLTVGSTLLLYYLAGRHDEHARIRLSLSRRASWLTSKLGYMPVPSFMRDRLYRFVANRYGINLEEMKN